MSVLVIIGPTASGKSEVAHQLALVRGGEIVNADALQVYRRLEIGTAKPDRQQRSALPYHLFDLLEPTERFSAGEFARRAAATIGEIEGRGRIAILVGGSGLYLRALFEGLAPIPAVPVAEREALAGRLASEGAPALHAELAGFDPVSAARIRVGDTQRILRALAVARATGRTLTEWLTEPRAKGLGSGGRVSVHKFGLTLPRAVLYDRIESRVHRMIQAGWLDEVRCLLAEGIAEDAPALQAIGYRDLVAHLRGEFGIDEATDRILRATRRYAKRQETWFRRESGVSWIDAHEPDRTAQEIGRILDHRS